MRLRDSILYLTVLLFVFSSIQIIANTNPEVTDVAFTSDGTTITVTYKLSDAEQTTVNIRMLVSEDSGTTWVDKTSEASGVGDLTGITTTPTVKAITWPYSGSNAMKVKILANDKTADGSPCAGTEKVYYGGGPNNDATGDYYSTIQIADQCWLKENLNIGKRIDGTSDQSQGDTDIEKYCYDNDPANCNTYGGLYEWNEAMKYVTTEGTQGICPDAWHIPTYSEMQTLQTYANDMRNSLTNTNETGFSALFVGDRMSSSSGFKDFGLTTFFWSSTKNYNDAWYMALTSNGSNVGFGSINTSWGRGFSIRCLKN